MLAIAFESVVKLLALLAVGPFVVWFLFDGPADMIGRLAEVPAVAERLTREASPLTWVVMSLLSGMAFLCLPRQFHVAVVEHDHPASLRTARWLFPAYLVLINLFVIPIAAAGLLLLGPSVSPDLYVLQLPLVGGESWLSAFVFIGGLSAATSMVIVACMALSGMIGNELLMPYLLRRQAGVARDMGPLVVLVRRAAVVLILMAGYAYERIISGYLPLASIGLISFCAVANFAPGLVLGLYWQRAHRFGVVAGLIGGFVVWLYALLLPTLRQGGGSGAGAGPMAPLGPFLPEPLAALDPVLQGFLVCIAVNTALLVGVSLLVRPVGRDREQADAFVLGAEPPPLPRRAPADAARIEELRQLLARFVGVERAARALSETCRWKRRWSAPSVCCRARWVLPRRASSWRPRRGAAGCCHAAPAPSSTRRPRRSATTTRSCATRSTMSAWVSRRSTARAGSRSSTTASPTSWRSTTMRWPSAPRRASSARHPTSLRY